MNKNLYPIVYIEWCDAINNKEEWLSIEEVFEWCENQNLITSQVGFVLKETKEYILICDKKSFFDEEDFNVNNITKIPITSIKNKMNLV